VYLFHVHHHRFHSKEMDIWRKNEKRNQKQMFVKVLRTSCSIIIDNLWTDRRVTIGQRSSPLSLGREYMTNRSDRDHTVKQTAEHATFDRSP
jgi:hypothetical protein